MWKYLAALLVVLLSLGGFGLVAAQTVPESADSYANIITQTDSQTIQNVRLGLEDPLDPKLTVAVGNEGLSAGIIVTKPVVEPADGAMFVQAPFARIDQSMDQTLHDIGPSDATVGEGAKGITWNKAIQAAWIANQGVKELETVNGVPTYVKEGSYISQSTTQLNLQASANSAAADSQSSAGSITNNVDVTVSGTDP